MLRSSYDACGCSTQTTSTINLKRRPFTPTKGKPTGRIPHLTPSTLVRIQVPQPARPVSGVLFPGWREPSTFPRVRRTRPTRFVAETVARAISAGTVMKISPAPFGGWLFWRAERLTSGEGKKRLQAAPRWASGNLQDGGSTICSQQKPRSFRCSAQPAGSRGVRRINVWAVSCGGFRPLMMAVVMSGASQGRRRRE
jgi:hypothetical protein